MPFIIVPCLDRQYCGTSSPLHTYEPHHSCGIDKFIRHFSPELLEQNLDLTAIPRPRMASLRYKHDFSGLQLVGTSYSDKPLPVSGKITAFSLHWFELSQWHMMDKIWILHNFSWTKKVCSMKWQLMYNVSQWNTRGCPVQFTPHFMEWWFSACSKNELLSNYTCCYSL